MVGLRLLYPGASPRVGDSPGIMLIERVSQLWGHQLL